MINETPVRKTKRIKQFKPKETLSTSEVQRISSILQYTLNQLEYKIHTDKAAAKLSKTLGKNDLSEYFYNKAQRNTEKVSKLAKIQRKLKKGLMQPYV